MQRRKDMESKIMLTSIAALFLSVAGANATEYRPFVGFTMGLSDANYSQGMEDFALAGHIDLPEDFFNIGLEAGVRFGEYTKIYNGGVMLNLDMTTNRNFQDKFTDAKYGKIRTASMSATYDNYFRLSGDKTSRIDAVLGAGLGVMNYHIDWKSNAVNDETVYSTILVLKAGMDFELTHNITLSATGRMFIPTRGHYALDAQYVFGGAVKYMF